MNRSALRFASRLASLGMLLSLGCTEVGATHLQIPMMVEGTAPSAIRVGEYEVEVQEARVAFGPLYLCTSRLPDVDICPAAIAENLTTTSFDALADAPTQAGTLQGFTQVSRSAMWDYGRTWRIADARPHASAQAVDGAHSAVMVLAATHLGETRHFRFVLDVDGGSQPSGTRPPYAPDSASSHSRQPFEKCTCALTQPSGPPWSTTTRSGNCRLRADHGAHRASRRERAAPRDGAQWLADISLGQRIRRTPRWVSE